MLYDSFAIEIVFFLVKECSIFKEYHFFNVQYPFELMLVVFNQLVVHLNRCYHQLMINIIETKPFSLDNLPPVVRQRQILSKDPLYAVRFGGKFSENKNILFDNIQEQQVELNISFHKYPKMI